MPNVGAPFTFVPMPTSNCSMRHDTIRIQSQIISIRPECFDTLSVRIDIDILSFNDIIINSDDLIIPHPKIKFRKFVLKPWTDIASDYILPNSKMTIKEHLDKISHLEDEIREYS